MYQKPALIVLTNDRGEATMSRDLGMQEPEPSSIVLTQGDHGTAWQLHFNDRLWHSTRGGRAVTWAWLTNQRNLRLAYDAPVRVGV